MNATSIPEPPVKSYSGVKHSNRKAWERVDAFVNAMTPAQYSAYQKAMTMPGATDKQRLAAVRKFIARMTGADALRPSGVTLLSLHKRVQKLERGL